jgi:hypothetical protein
MNLSRTSTIAAAGILALATLSACGGGSSTGSAPSSTPSSTSASSSGSMPSGAPDLTAYRDCMSSNGVDLPDFGGGPPAGMPSGMPTAMPSGAPGAMPSGGAFALPDGVDQKDFDAAQAACQDLAPQFGAGGPGAPVDIDASALAAFRSCLTDNGVPVTADQDPLRDLDRSDPTVTAAFDTCSPLLPTPSGAPAG